jgi:AcrR family transcriptional regulator
MVDAARHIFAERGFARATLDEIAARAEFGKGTIYNYFPGGKDEILFAILDEFYDGLTNLVDVGFSEKLTDRQSPREVFQSFVQSVFDFFNERDDLFLVALKESHRHMFGSDQGRADYFLKRRDDLVGRLAAEVQRFMDSGDVKALDPGSVAHMILGNLNGYQAHACLCRRSATDGPGSASDGAEFLTTILLDGLLNTR